MTDSIVEQPRIAVGTDFEDEFPGARRLATLCSSNLIRTADRLLTEINRRRRTVTDLSPNATEILAIVEGAGEPLPPHVIAERLLVTSGTMTSLLDTLERRNLIRRVPHPDDRRKLLIAITEEARSVVDRMLPRIHAASRDAFSVLSDDECRTLVSLLERVQGRLEELAGEIPTESGERRVPRNQ